MSIINCSAVEVKLTRGLVAIIDVEDLELVSQFKWYATRGQNTDYATRKQRVGDRQKTVILHRFLLSAPSGMHVDHINGNGLDNRRENLRLCTLSDNLKNRQKPKGCRSEFKGVSKNRDGSPKPWRATIQIDKKPRVKSFPNEIEAALWYDKMAMEHFGEFANLNFPKATVMIENPNNSEVKPDGRQDGSNNRRED